MRARAGVRRRAWFLDNLTLLKVGNAALAGLAFAMRRSKTHSLPVVLKVDISPVCNLHCTVCVHAQPGPGSSSSLVDQTFRGTDRMSISQFTRICDEVSGRTMAMSLYYLGDPLTHPDLAALCRVATDRNINTHVSTNFSFNLSDGQIEELVLSGLTHLTVCIDGLKQDTYERTRVGGQIHLVLDNLERLLACRARFSRTFPRVEVQYIQFQHNVEQVEDVRALCAALKVDVFTSFWGGLHNYTDRPPTPLDLCTPHSRKVLGRCEWPHFAMVVKYTGDVIPCCVYRLGEQYALEGAPHSLGNVFQVGVKALWNDPSYQRVRQHVLNTKRNAGREDGSFCDGCPKLYASKHHPPYRSARTFQWEQFYELGKTGRPIRHSALPQIREVPVSLTVRDSIAHD